MPFILVLASDSELHGTAERSTSDYGNTLFLQDLDVFSFYMHKKDFMTSLILSNRIMANAYLFDNQTFGIIGIFLRYIVTDGLMLNKSNNINAINSFSENAEIFTSTIKRLIADDKLDITPLWSEYSNFMLKTRTCHLIDGEQNSYETPNFAFAKISFMQIIEELSDNKDLLLYPSNNLLNGIVNELSRISKTYGIEQHEQYSLISLSLLSNIGRYNVATDYDSEFKKRITVHHVPLVDEFLKLSMSDNTSIEDYAKYLWKLVKLWRSYSIRYPDPSEISVELQTSVVSESKPAQIKSQLVNEITRELGERI